MTRVKRGNVARKKREKIFQISSGFRGSSSNLFRVANQHALKALKSSYRDRRYKKRDFRKDWIVRINAAVKVNSFNSQNYNIFMSKLKNCSLALNRKVLATLAVKDYSAFLQVQNYINKNTNKFSSLTASIEERN